MTKNDSRLNSSTIIIDPQPKLLGSNGIVTPLRERREDPFIID